MTIIFDPAQRACQRFRGALIEKLDRYFLFDWTMREIEDRLSIVRRTFPLAVRVGARGRNMNVQEFGIDRLFTMDQANIDGASVIAHEDVWPFANASLDLIVSPLALHTVNDLPGALIQMRRSLKPDGLFLAAMLGGESLHELRESLQEAELHLTGGASPRVAPFAEMRQMGSLMQRAGFALPVVDSERLTVTYDTIFALMHDLRAMGETNALATRSRTFSPRGLFTRAGEIYADRFSDPDGRIRATFDIVFLLGWAPHEGQQKPLRPGSATSRLADLLGTSEISTGEKP